MHHQPAGVAYSCRLVVGEDDSPLHVRRQSKAYPLADSLCHTAGDGAIGVAALHLWDFKDGCQLHRACWSSMINSRQVQAGAACRLVGSAWQEWCGRLWCSRRGSRAKWVCKGCLAGGQSSLVFDHPQPAGMALICGLVVVKDGRPLPASQPPVGFLCEHQQPLPAFRKTAHTALPGDSPGHF